MFLLMLRCGLRLSEMCHLIWAAINWEAGSIRIDNGKDHVDRVVYYTSDVEQALRQWQSLDGAGSPYLFPSPVQRRRGQPLTPRLIQRLMTRYCQQAQISTRYSPHCLRHSFATELLNAGASLEVVRELMGHRHISMTLRYTQLSGFLPRASKSYIPAIDLSGDGIPDPLRPTTFVHTLR